MTETFLEDNPPGTYLEDVVADDSKLPMPILMTGGELPENMGVGEHGMLVSLVEAEDIDLEPEIASTEADLNDQPNSDELSSKEEG